MSVQTITGTVDLMSPTGSIVTALKVTALTITQDEATSPMVTATATVTVPTPAQYAMLKPGAGYYLQVNATETRFANVANAFILKITDRSRTPSGLVELQAASAEVELQAYTPSQKDSVYQQYQSNVTSIITTVLNKVYGTGYAYWTYGPSQAFGEDIGTPTYRTYSAVTNLIANPSFEYGTTGWTATRGTIRTQAWTGGLGPNMGTTTLRVEGSGSNNDTFASTPVTLQPNTTYTLSGYLLNGATQTGANAWARRMTVVVNVNGSAFVLAQTNQGSNAANAITFVATTFTTPAMMDSTGATVRVYNGTTSGSSNPVLWDGLSLTEGNGRDTDGVTRIPFFDGDTTDGTNGYNYDWQGDAGNSASTRTPIIDRDPESLVWSPGQSAWDFLQPILQATGVRLYTTGYETQYSPGTVKPKVFLTTNEFGFIVGGRRAHQDYNIFDVSQVDSWSAEFSDGTPMYADQVILHYTWIDSLGQQQEKYDVYPATGKKPYVKELPDTPFAGVGRAQGIWKRINARSGIVQGTTWFDRGYYVGQQLVITADAIGGSVTGYLEAVTHDPFRGTTEFRTKQTVAYTSASWYSASGTWASQTGSWAADS